MVCLIAGAVVTLVLWIGLRRVIQTVVAGSLAIVFLTGDSNAAGVGLVIASWLAIAFWHRATGADEVRFPAAGIAALTGGVTVIGLASAVISGIFVSGDFELPHGAQARRVAMPSVYVLLFDGYPRADTLRTEFGYDNSPFISQLEDRGFQYYPNAVSPAAQSELTILSALGVDVAANMPRPFEPAVDQRRMTRAQLRHAPGSAELSAAGYRRVHIASGVVHTNFSGWDEVIDTGQINEIEARLLRRSPFGSLLGPWVRDQRADRLEASLDALVERADDDRQQVVLAHLMAPHPTFPFDPDGSEADLSCWSERRCDLFEIRPEFLGLSADAYAAALSHTLDALNAKAVRAVDDILEADPAAIIIIMSDHGARHSGEVDEWYRSFLAARGTNAFDPEASPRDLFRRILADIEGTPEP